MGIVERLNSLWGGIIDSVTFDVVHHQAELAIRLTEGNQVSRYQLSFTGIAEFRFTKEEVGMFTWNYAELTEIRCSFQPDESVLTEIVMWDESSQLIVRSLGIDLKDVHAGPEILVTPT